MQHLNILGLQTTCLCILLWDLDNDRFGFSVGFDTICSKFPTLPRHLVASERHGGVKHIVAVHPDSASPQTVGKEECSLNVLGVDGGSQAIDGVVGAVKQLCVVLELHDGHHWPKDLFLSNGHLILHISKHSRGHKESLVPNTASLAMVISSSTSANTV